MIYQGAFNLFEVAVKNQKMHLYDVLDRNNIDYDVYISFSPGFYLKNPSREVVLQTIDYVRDQCQSTQLLHDYRSNFNDPALVTKQPDGWYALDFGVSAEHINKVIRASGIQDKIVRLNISEYISWADHIRQADNSNHLNYFTTAGYQGLKETRDYIKQTNVKYDYFITLRPELVFDGRFNIMDFLQSDDFVTHAHGRLDFIQLSKTLLPDMINGDVERMGTEYEYGSSGNATSFEPLFESTISKLIGIHLKLVASCIKIDTRTLPGTGGGASVGSGVGAVLKHDGIFENEPSAHLRGLVQDEIRAAYSAQMEAALRRSSR